MTGPICQTCGQVGEVITVATKTVPRECVDCRAERAGREWAKTPFARASVTTQAKPDDDHEARS